MQKVTHSGQVPHILFQRPCVGELFSPADYIAHTELTLLISALAYGHFVFLQQSVVFKLGSSLV